MSAGLMSATCLVLAHDAVAAEPDAPDSLARVYTFEEIVVTAPRPATTIGGAAAVETDVDSLPLPPAPTTAEVLKELPLLHVRTNSRGEAEISARGSESRQVAVLVDGVPITLAWDARADVSIIPATAIREVTYIRGLSSLLHGPNVLGGIVEASIGRSLDQPEARSTEVTIGTDHLGGYGTTVATAVPFGGSSGKWLVRAGLGYRNSPGDPRAGEIEEPVSTDDDLRLNTDHENMDGFLSLRYRSRSDAWISLSSTTFRAERGIAAELGVPDEGARLWRYPRISRTLLVLSGGTGYGRSPFGGRGDVAASLGYDRGRTDIDSYTSRSYEEKNGFEDGKDRTVTFRVSGEQTVGSRGEIRTALTGAEIHHDESTPDGTFGYRQRLWSAAAENVWRLLDGKGAFHNLNVSLGAAWDGSDTPKSGGREPLGQLTEWGGRLGLSAAVGSRPTILHAGVSRRGRFPALRELYSGALNRFAPNPDLKPERLVTAEAGVTSRLGTGEIQAVLFHNELHDAVVRITLPDRRFMRVNRNTLKSTGLELVGVRRLGNVELSGSATFQNVDLTDAESDATTHPENLPETFGEIATRLPLPLNLSARAAVNYTGRQFCLDPVSGEEVRLDGEAVANAGLSRFWPVRLSWAAGHFTSLETRISVDNVGDVALYDACGLPEPGRRARFEVRLR